MFLLQWKLSRIKITASHYEKLIILVFEIWLKPFFSFNWAQPWIDITDSLPVLLPDTAQWRNAASLGQLVDRRALERNIMSTLWVENVPLCVRVCVLSLSRHFSRPLAGNVRFSSSGNIVCVCVCGCLCVHVCVFLRDRVLNSECGAVRAWSSVFACFSLWMWVCMTDVMFEPTQTDKPNQGTHTHKHKHAWVCACT